MSTRRIGSLVVIAATAVGLAACGGDRSGTIVGGQTPAISITVGSCVPGTAGTTVNWSGFSTAQVQVIYAKNTLTASSAWVTVSPAATSGSKSVPTPSGVSATWAVTGVRLGAVKNDPKPLQATISCATSGGTGTSTNYIIP